MTDNREYLHVIGLSKQEKEWVRVAAAKAGCRSMAEYLRGLIQEQIRKDNQ